MDAHLLLETINNLSDLELAILLSLVAQSHCLITTDDALLDDLSNELALVASERFNLSYAILDLDDYDSIDCFGEAILEPPDSPSTAPRTQVANVAIRAGSRAQPSTSSSKSKQQSRHQSQPHQADQSSQQILDEPLTHEPLSNNSFDNRTIKSIIVAKHFNLAPHAIQIQALELITAKRFLSHTTLHTTGKQFLFLPLLSTAHPQHLIPHLNDRLTFSHYHDPEDGLVNLEELEDSSLSTSKPLPQHHQLPPSSQDHDPPRQIPPTLLAALQHQSKLTTLTSEIRRYMQDLITFLRLARGVDGGVTPRATQDLVALTKILAPIHGMSYVTPSLVALAMRKVYPHRISIASVERERSMQYGSEPGAVLRLLDGLRPEDIIEDVLGEVPGPR